MFFTPSSEPSPVPSEYSINPQTSPLFPHLQGKKSRWNGSAEQRYLIWEIETKNKIKNLWNRYFSDTHE